MLGITAAICWGLTDFLVAVVARKIGPVKVLCLMTLGALALYTAVFRIVSPQTDYARTDVLVLAGLSFIIAATYISFYKGLELGPVAIVAPIVAAYAAVVVPLAVIFLGERLSTLQTIGAVAALTGVVLASADLRALPSEGKRFGLGVLLGILALFGFGVTTFVGGYYSQKYDFIGPALISRIVLTVLFFVVGAARKQLPGKSEGGRLWLWVVLLGAMESAGFLAFAKGAEIGLISIVAIATASYPIIPLVLGVTVLKERPAPNQWLGVAVVLLGVGMLAAT